MTLDEIFHSERYQYFYNAWWEMRPHDIPACNTCQSYVSHAWRDELTRMAAWQAHDLAGEKVIFWGAGEAYRAYKIFFANTKPVAMLLDTQKGEREESIDGIPIYHPDDFLASLTEPLPLVVFAMQDASPHILRKLEEKYPFYKPSKLVICPANAHIVAPVEPYFKSATK